MASHGVTGEQCRDERPPPPLPIGTPSAVAGGSILNAPHRAGFVSDQ